MTISDVSGSVKQMTVVDLLENSDITVFMLMDIEHFFRTLEMKAGLTHGKCDWL